jgi:type IV secretion system protein VirD4
MNIAEKLALAAAAVVAWRVGSPGARGGGAWARDAPVPSARPGRLASRSVRRRRDAPDPARWATRRDLGDLRVPHATAGRVTLGVAQRRLLAAEAGHSVLVVGPTQSRKTTGFAIPAILEWRGPVVAASVKSDLVRHTRSWRSGRGPVWVYDPTGSTDLPAAAWSPLTGSHTWDGARKTASSLTEVARSGAGTLTDGDFWYSTAAKLLAPLLFAAAASGRTMADVVRWVDTQEVDEVFDALVASEEPAALQSARASWGRDERQRSAVHDGRRGSCARHAVAGGTGSVGSGRVRRDARRWSGYRSRQPPR